MSEVVESWEGAEKQAFVARWRDKYNGVRTQQQVRSFYAALVDELQTLFPTKLNEERIRELKQFWTEASEVGGPIPSTFLEELPSVADILFEKKE